MAKRLRHEELEERVAALEKENRQLRKGLERTEALMEGNQSLEFLKVTAEAFAHFSVEENIHEFIGLRLKELVNDSVVIINSYEKASDSLCVRAMVGMGDQSGQVPGLLGGSPVGMCFRIDDPQGREALLRGKLVEGQQGLFDPSFGAIPREVCRTIEEILSVRRIYTRGLAYKEELLGSAIILAKKEGELKNRFAMEAFINQAVMALQRRATEEALRESNANVRALINNPVDSVLLVDPDGIIIEANQTFAQRMGRRVDELIGRCVYDFLPPELAKSRRASVDEIVRLEVPVRLEDERAGMWLDHCASPIFDAQGRVVRIAVVARDITERKRAEEELKKSVQLLKDTGEMAKVGGWELDLSTKEVLWTEEVGRIHGVAPGYQPKLKEAMNFYAPESRPALDVALKKAAETGEPYDIESLFIPSDGKEKIWVRSVGRAVYSGGKIVKLMGTFQDIDRYKRAEEELRVSLEKYRVLFESFPLGITISDKSGNVIEANRQSEHLLGVTPEAHVQKRIDSKEWQIIRKDGTPMAADEYASTRALRENRLIENVEMGIVKDKGEITWISVTAAPIPLEGYGVAIAYGDITERKRVGDALRESEELYRSVVESSNDGIGISCKNKRVYVNKKFLEIFGYTSPEEVLGKQSSLIVHPDDLERYAKIGRRRERGEMAPSRYEFKGLRKGGEVVYVEVSVSKITYGGKPCSLTFVRDISARNKVEQELRESQERLFQAQKMETLGTLVAGVAHEINNPINLIMFNVPLLQKVWRDILPILEKHALHEPHKKYGGLTSEFLRQDLDKLLRDVDLAANRVATIVSGLKDFAKMSDIRDKMPMQINEAVTNAMRLAQTTLRKAGIDVELELGQDLPLIEGNLQGLEQIVLNLMVNASQAIEHENGRIRVKTGLDERKGQIVVVVSDNGKGIDPSIYGRIFDPFFTSRQAYGGTGLGLAVSYSIAKAHDGEITFESEVGRGTTFTVTLPSTLKGKRARILVADDEKSLRDIIVHALTRHQPYVVEEASTVAETLLKIGTFRPDLVVLDVFMPDTDGLDVCRALKKDPRLSGIKVLIITGHADDPKVDQIKRLGFEQILEKPLRIGDLLHEADKILGEGKRGNRK